MSEFKVGDMVQVVPLRGTKLEVSSVITRTADDGMLYVNLGEDGSRMVIHPDRCRKLVKKERRRVWVHPEYFAQIITYNGPYPDLNHFVSDVSMDGWYEFVEVKSK